MTILYTKPTITPTIGRRLWYWPHESEKTLAGHSQPFDAGICHVNADGTVNLDVKDEMGCPVFDKINVTLVEAGTKPQPGQASWMDYQISNNRA